MFLKLLNLSKLEILFNVNVIDGQCLVELVAFLVQKRFQVWNLPLENFSEVTDFDQKNGNVNLVPWNWF